MKRFLVLIIFISETMLWTQSVSGTVSDRVTQGSLSGVNITIAGSDRGASSSENGTYEIDISGLDINQQIKFQHIGYDELLLTISELTTSTDVKMNPRVLQFEAIETAGAKRKASITKDLPQTVSILQG